MSRKYTIPALIIAALLITAFHAGGIQQHNKLLFAISSSMEIFGAVFREISMNYVDETEPEDFIVNGANAMLNQLDPYTEVLDEKGEDDFEMLTTNTYTGFGFVVGNINGRLTVVEIYDGYSAQKNGVRPGDQIVMMDSVHVLYDTTNLLRRYSRGAVGSKVQLRLLREGRADTINTILVRDAVKVQSLNYTGMLNDSIGYISIDRFSATTPDEVKRALITMRREEHHILSGLVLDLRDNPGGLLEAAVGVAELFLPRNSTIVVTKGRNKQEEKTYKSGEDPIEPDLPLVVLLNGMSASASEVLAGALQDHDRAVIAGEQSYGKGLVQTVIALPGEHVLKMTTARYYTPSGRCIQKITYKNDKSAEQNSNAIFKTSAGRAMQARHGIAPDTVIQPRTLRPWIRELQNNWAFVRFAAYKLNRTDSLPPDWKAGENEYNAFVKWLEQNPEIPGPEPVQNFKALQQAASENGFSQDFLRKTMQLKELAISEKKNALKSAKAEIILMLNDAMQACCRSRKAMIALRSRTDQQIQYSAALINSEAYFRLLMPRM
jgi:carboxyl-terminal processing protease